jgi:acetolactate synthase-1/2/3 large subunit
MSTPPPETNGADAMIRALADAGVTHCFANPGTSELDLVVALDKEPRIRPVPVVFEGVASGAADGFGRMTGAPAAVLLHLGPGYLNAGANFHNARRARTPIVNIVGDHATSHRAMDAPLSSDIATLVGPNSAWVRDVADANDAAGAGVAAVEAALRLRGTATLIVTADAAWGGAPLGAGAVPSPTHPAASERAVEHAVHALRAAKSPVVFVSGWALQGAGLTACARLQAAGVRVVAETFPARWERGAGRPRLERLMYFTEMGLAQLGATDLIVLAGAKSPVGFFAYQDKPDTPVPPGCQVVTLCDADQDEAASLAALADALGAPAAPQAPAGGAMPAPTGALTAATVAQALARHLPEGAIVSDDGVTAGLPSFLLTEGAAPHDWLFLTGGALGQGVPVAAGAAIACPDRKVVCLMGDGAMLYAPQGLWTIARENLDVVTIVAVNRAYEILKVELSRMGASNIGPAAAGLLDLGRPNVDYVRLSQGLGVEAVRCETAEAFDAALAAAMGRRGPMVIEAAFG